MFAHIWAASQLLVPVTMGVGSAPAMDLTTTFLEELARVQRLQILRFHRTGLLKRIPRLFSVKRLCLVVSRTKSLRNGTQTRLRRFSGVVGDDAIFLLESWLLIAVSD